jgi:8-oxo-dGTP pyrophosphatase MutT (NUDIX family)
MIEKWETLGVESSEDFRIFTAIRIKRRHPAWKREGSFVVLDSPQWVNIIPVTTEGNIVLIEQYRHGADSITIEVPGGLVEHGEATRIAAERECLEETGYGSNQEAELLGKILPNPAFLNNECFSYVWFGCELKSEQHLDRHEDIRVFEASQAEVKDMILDGRINHSLVLDAFLYYIFKYGFK